MKYDRLPCPSCGENVAGHCRVGGVVGYESNRSTGLIMEGTVPCRCGAVLMIVKGQVIEFAPPAVKPRLVEKVEVLDRG